MQMDTCRAFRPKKNAPQMHLNEYTTIEAIILGYLSSFHMLIEDKSLSYERNCVALMADHIATLKRLLRNSD